MHERLDQWDFVAAAYVVAVVAIVLLVGWTLHAMRRSEKRRDNVKKRK